MHFQFASDDQKQKAYVKLRYYDNSDVTEWEVNLDGLPDDGQGREMTVNWKSYDINNKDTFYTDSNALEM